MAMARLVLRPMAGIERPAIAALWRRSNRNASCSTWAPHRGFGAAAGRVRVMGAAMARALFHVERPTVGLLTWAWEEIKGGEEVKEAHAILKGTELPLDYRGYIEGDEIGTGGGRCRGGGGVRGEYRPQDRRRDRQADRTISERRHDAVLGLEAGGADGAGRFQGVETQDGPRRVNGGTFLGLNGIAVKSHGGIDALGFASAVDLGYEMAQSGLLERLGSDLDGFHHTLDRSRRRGRPGPDIRRLSGEPFPTAGRKGRNKKRHERGSHSIGHSRGGRTSAQARRHERGSGQDRGHVGRVDRRAFGNPVAAHRGDDELTSDLGVAAARQALVGAGIDPVDIDLVICATATPDKTFPAPPCAFSINSASARARPSTCRRCVPASSSR